MQCLDAAVHDLGKAGQLGDVAHGYAGFGDRLRGAAGGDQFDAGRGERLGEIDEAGLVENGQQRAADRNEVGRWNVFAGDGHGLAAFHGWIGKRDRAVAYEARKSSRALRHGRRLKRVASKRIHTPRVKLLFPCMSLSQNRCALLRDMH
ncbi:hypothetical protein AJ88_30040 [Mesorhizobium amorphae CCBAU 01583]|nr:hypothetical protein AJ88_30040 [Mesorhizobium amorphae CCBAU 01583]